MRRPTGGRDVELPGPRSSKAVLLGRPGEYKVGRSRSGELSPKLYWLTSPYYPPRIRGG